jgi:hypothetical protein
MMHAIMMQHMMPASTAARSPYAAPAGRFKIFELSAALNGSGSGKEGVRLIHVEFVSCREDVIELVRREFVVEFVEVTVPLEMVALLVPLPHTHFDIRERQTGSCAQSPL